MAWLTSPLSPRLSHAFPTREMGSHYLQRASSGGVSSSVAGRVLSQESITAHRGQLLCYLPGLLSQITTTGALATTESYSLAVPEARGPKSWCLQEHTPPESSRVEPSLPLAASGGSWCSSDRSNSWLCLHMAVLPVASALPSPSPVLGHLYPGDFELWR